MNQPNKYSIVNKSLLLLLQGWFIFLTIAGTSLSLVSQSLHGYEFQTFERPYEPLENYQSMLIEQRGYQLWEYEFNLGFSFPFFGKEYKFLVCDFLSFCATRDDVGYLDLNSYPYFYDFTTDSTNIKSDVRFSTLGEDGEKVFVMEFFKNRLREDPSVTTYDSHVNFQNRIYEDGTIEIHYGPSNLDNSPLYVPGEGFYVDAGGTFLFGPSITLEEFDVDSLGVLKRLSLTGPYNNLAFTEEESEYITTYPPEGFVIQLRPKTLSADDPVKPSELLAYPNPVEDIINFRAKDDRIIGGRLYDMLGNRMSVDIKENQISVQHLPSGMYILEVETATGQVIREKIIKQ